MSNRANFAVCSPTSFVLMKDILCRRAYSHEHLIHFFYGSYGPFEHRNLAKIKNIAKTDCQPNSSETPQQNLLKLCSYEGHTVYMFISTGHSDLIVF